MTIGIKPSLRAKRSNPAVRLGGDYQTMALNLVSFDQAAPLDCFAIGRPKDGRPSNARWLAMTE